MNKRAEMHTRLSFFSMSMLSRARHDPVLSTIVLHLHHRVCLYCYLCSTLLRFCSSILHMSYASHFQKPPLHHRQKHVPPGFPILGTFPFQPSCLSSACCPSLEKAIYSP
ncbi:unnamed protein product [Cuscuta europaea]|uniref:Uncharacterized protein n=1 Tax=Cuscuta europaea TaxID=41803 RepID=A0A9P0Z5J8_CUSEU|nr:unnamed protein product [Cuscuta europaea]